MQHGSNFLYNNYVIKTLVIDATVQDYATHPYATLAHETSTMKVYSSMISYAETKIITMTS